MAAHSVRIGSDHTESRAPASFVPSSMIQAQGCCWSFHSHAARPATATIATPRSRVPRRGCRHHAAVVRGTGAAREMGRSLKRLTLATYPGAHPPLCDEDNGGAAHDSLWSLSRSSPDGEGNASAL